MITNQAHQPPSEASPDGYGEELLRGRGQGGAGGSALVLLGLDGQEFPVEFVQAVVQPFVPAEVPDPVRAIREIARETGLSIRQVLHETVYHEVFHKLVAPIEQWVSRRLGIRSIYEYSAEIRAIRGWRGWEFWEEAFAEAFGKSRAALRKEFCGK